MKLKCNLCGDEVEGFVKSYGTDDGKSVVVQIKRLPFGLCPECFGKKCEEHAEQLLKDLPSEIHAIAMESALETVKEKKLDWKVFDYQCPECGVKAMGIGTEEQHQTALAKKPICPECQQAKRNEVNEQSFPM